MVRCKTIKQLELATSKHDALAEKNYSRVGG
jgi:hypothetical protein